MVADGMFDGLLGEITSFPALTYFSPGLLPECRPGARQRFPLLLALALGSLAVTFPAHFLAELYCFSGSNLDLASPLYLATSCWRQGVGDAESWLSIRLLKTYTRLMPDTPCALHCLM